MAGINGKYILTILAALLVLSAFAAASTASASNSTSNSINKTNPTFKQPAQSSQQVVINIASSKNVRTQAKTDLVSGAIVLIGVAGIGGGREP